MNLGQSIKKIRKEQAKMNQVKFAELIGLTQSYLSCIENGSKQPSVSVLKIISEKVNVPLPVLFWMSMDESDVAKHKREVFLMIKPHVDAFVKQII